jgi:molybdenum cofactor biosynthesis enzyme MoaA
MLEVIEHLKQNGVDLSFLRYGFQFKRSEVAEEIVHDHMESVKKKALENVRRTGNPSLVVIEAIDDSWEVGVMKFTIDMIMKSSEINRFDFKRRGLM